MLNKNQVIKQNIIKAVKILFCVITVLLMSHIFCSEGFDYYFTSVSYDVRGEVLDGNVAGVAKGNHLTYLVTDDNKTIEINVNGLKRGDTFKVPVELENGSVMLHFVYTYISISSILYLAFRVTFAIVCAWMICYSIMRIEDGVGYLRRGGAVRWPGAVSMSALTLLGFNPFAVANRRVTSFARYIGCGLANDYDVTKVIRNFMAWVLAFVALAFLYLLFFRLMGERNKESEEGKAWEFTHKFFVLGGVLMGLSCVTFFDEQSKAKLYFSYSESAVRILLLAFFGYMVLKLFRKINFERFLALVLCAAPLGVPVAILLPNRWQEGIKLVGVQFVMLIILLLVLKFAPISKENGFAPIRMWPVLMLSLIPLATSWYIEGIAIANQHEIFIGAVKAGYAIGMSLLIIIAICLPIFTKTFRFAYAGWKDVCYPVLVGGVTALSVQPALSAVYDADLYETANYSVLISDFLNHGTIPIVEHYGGHMMTGVWEGVLYGLLNGDVFGGSMSPYSGGVAIITTLCFYFLVKHVWDEDMAFLTALLFPFGGYWNYYGQGMLIGLAILGFAKKHTYVRAAFIWLAFAWVTLYRLDMGTAFGAAAVLCLVAYCVIKKDKNIVKMLFSSLAAVGAFFLFAWIIICVIKGVSPIDRMLEFIKVSASNITWARDAIGDAGKADFSWGYIFIPVGVTTALGYTLISKRFREDAGEERYLLLLLFGGAYVANIQRSLVRHTLDVENYDVVIWSSLVFLALFISAKKSRNLFIPSFTAMMLLASLLGSQNAYSEQSVVAQAATILDEHLDEWAVERVDLEDAENEEQTLTPWKLRAIKGEKVERVVLSDESQNRIGLFVSAIDTLLDEDETYVDMENHTFLYTATGKENPVYVSQSPMQLSGEFTQEMFIREIEAHNCPIAVLPATGESSFASVRLDGLENAYRYYYISEYIYDNYRPLCVVGEYALWAKNNCYHDKLARIANIKEVEQIDKLIAGFSFSGCTMEKEEEGLTIVSTAGDPFVAGLENSIDLAPYVGGNVRVVCDYKCAARGTLELFYTTEKDEGFSSEKVVGSPVNGDGTAEFIIPVTSETRLRMDIPEKCKFVITSIRTASAMQSVDYGYDRISRNVDSDELLKDTSAHIYNLKNLPFIWANMDVNNAVAGEEICELKVNGEVFSIPDIGRIDRTVPAYLLLDMTYAGRDDYDDDNDDEKTEVIVRVGRNSYSGFTENARYVMQADEGTYKYLIRISSDYFWRSGGMMDLRVDGMENVTVNSAKIIVGD